MAIIKDHLARINKANKQWDFATEKSKNYITKTFAIPFLLALLTIVISLGAGLITGDLSIQVVLIEMIFAFFLVYTTLLFIRRRYRLVRVFLVFIFFIVSVLSFLNWGVLHYIGVSFGVLLLLLSYFTFPVVVVCVVTILYLITTVLIGILQINGVLKYGEILNQTYSIFDLIIVVALFFTIAHVLWIYHISYLNRMNRNKGLVEDLRKSNDCLNERVIKQTMAMMSNRLSLDKTQKVLSRAYERLENSEKVKFVHMNQLAHNAITLSKCLHNVKTPLMYCMNLVKERHSIYGVERDDVLEALTEISKELELIRMDTNHCTKSTKFELIDTVNDACHILEWKFDELQVPMPIVHRDELRQLWGPRSKLLHAMVNLIDNSLDAIKDVESPLLEVFVDGCIHFITISVIDNGAGIPPKDMSKLFTPFYTQKSDGIGLGLYIAREHIKDGFGGDIVYDRVDSKTKFSIKLPHPS